MQKVLTVSVSATSLVLLSISVSAIQNPPPLSAPGSAQKQAAAAHGVVNRWSGRLGGALRTQGYDPGKLAAQLRNDLKGMSLKDPAANRKIMGDASARLAPTLNDITRRNLRDLQLANTDLASTMGIHFTGPMRTEGGHFTVNPGRTGGGAQPSTDRPTGHQFVDVSLPFDDRATFDDGSSFLSPNTMHIFNGGQIISPQWSTKISAAQVVNLGAQASTATVNVDLATDREYFAGAFTAYASIGANVTVSVEDMDGHTLATKTTSLQGATAPFIGQSHPHYTEDVTTQVIADLHNAGTFKIRVTANSSSTLFGPGVVSDDVMLTMRSVHVDWLPA